MSASQKLDVSQLESFSREQALALSPTTFNVLTTDQKNAVLLAEVGGLSGDADQVFDSGIGPSQGEWIQTAWFICASLAFIL